MDHKNEKTLVLIKPDGIKRGLIGEIITRFERVGLKILATRMVQADEALALRHYTEDITERRGQHVRDALVGFLMTGPVLAIVLEGVNAIAVVRKMIGDTEPSTALPGTIRGDYAHVSFERCNATNKAVENLVHASSSQEDAMREIAVWFQPEEQHTYKTVHELHTF